MAGLLREGSWSETERPPIMRAELRISKDISHWHYLAEARELSGDIPPLPGTRTMYHPAPERGPATPQERWFAVVFMIILVGLLAAEVVHDYSPVKLSALLVLLFWIPLL